MKTEEIKINRDESGKIQWLTEVLKDSVIPSNIILFKTLPGIGATHSELLLAKRNSIIIEPNVPVIKGKGGKSKKEILGVCKGINVDDVIGYLSNTDIEYKKIIVTPESYYKIIEAADALKIDVYNTYFLLFDECDRTSKDVDYRDSITAPMGDFFKFKQKSFVSATAIEPSDLRFVKQKFVKMVVKPSFKFAKALTLIETNNVFLTIRELVKRLETESETKTYCIFFNSINGIVALAKYLGLKNSDYTIYCSTTKKSLLKANGFKNVKDEIDNKFTKYNFFTSRFYSAVDIKMKEQGAQTIIKPTILMLTHLHIAEHTMVDPQSDAVQIVGRFRDGVSQVYSIANISDKIKYMDAEDARRFLSESRTVYTKIRTLYNSTSTEGGREVLSQVLNLIHYSRFVMPDGKPNHYMHDNFYHKEHLKSLYTNWKSLEDAYSTEYFNLTVQKEDHIIDDSATIFNINKPSFKALVKIVCEALATIEKQRENAESLTLDNTSDLLYDLETDFPVIVRGYKMLGMEDTIKLGTSNDAIERAIDKKHYADAKGDFDFIRSLYRALPVGTKSILPDLKEKMTEVARQHGLSLSLSKDLLDEYFTLSGRKKVKGEQKGFEILSHLYFVGQ